MTRRTPGQRRRTRLVWGLVVVAFASTILWVWQPLCWVLTTEKRYFEEVVEGRAVRGWHSSWPDVDLESGPFAAYWAETGFKAFEGYAFAGIVLSETHWEADGTLRSQTVWNPQPIPTLGMWWDYRMHGYRPTTGVPRIRKTGPWEWGVTDQADPSAPPWVLDDARWQATVEDRAR